MVVNRIPDGDVAAVRLYKVSMVGLELLNVFRHPELVEAGAVRV